MSFFSTFINFTFRMLTHICNWSKSFILNDIDSLLTRFKRIFSNLSRIHTWFRRQFFIFFRQVDEQRTISSFNFFIFSSFWSCLIQHLTKTCIRTRKSFIHEKFFSRRLISVTLYFAHFFFFFQLFLINTVVAFIKSEILNYSFSSRIIHHSSRFNSWSCIVCNTRFEILISILCKLIAQLKRVAYALIFIVASDLFWLIIW